MIDNDELPGELTWGKLFLRATVIIACIFLIGSVMNDANIVVEPGETVYDNMDDCLEFQLCYTTWHVYEFDTGIPLVIVHPESMEVPQFMDVSERIFWKESDLFR